MRSPSGRTSTEFLDVLAQLGRLQLLVRPLGPVGAAPDPLPAVGDGVVERLRLDVVHRDLGVTIAAAQQHQGRIDRDPVHPTAELRPALEGRQVPPRREKGLLQDLLRVGLVAHEAHGQSVQLLLVAADQLLEGRLVLAARPLDQDLVAGVRDGALGLRPRSWVDGLAHGSSAKYHKSSPEHSRVRSPSPAPGLGPWCAWGTLRRTSPPWLPLF